MKPTVIDLKTTSRAEAYELWMNTGLLWAGAFGCLMAALNFWDSKNDGG